MFEVFGNEWVFQYSEKEFSDLKKQGFFHNLKSLPTIFANKEPNDKMSSS